MGFSVEATSANTAVYADDGRGFGVINMAGVPDVEISENASMREIASRLSSWLSRQRSVSGHSSMFDRGAFTPPDNFYEELRAARQALETDDIVAGVAEITEGFAFQGVKWEGPSQDDADVFNQMSRDWNLDAVIRRCWREEYATGQFVVATRWGYSDYTVRGINPPADLPLEQVTDPVTGQTSFREPVDPKTNRPMKKSKGTKRKKKYRVWCPQEITVLDSSKVVPVNFGPLGSEQLAWCSDNQEVDYFFQAKNGQVIDPVMVQFFLAQFHPSKKEESELAALGVDVENLLLMNPEMVFRHTMTKADYERFAPIRLKSIFSLLDLKRQLVNSDRASLIGSANYILLIRKGSDQFPAQQTEIDNLKENYNFLAKMPVIIADHRLEIDIIAPKVDFTLTAEKYDVIDTRILSRLLGTLTISGRGQRNETNLTLSRAVAKVMENRRHMIRRTFERHISRVIVEHPLNSGVFEEKDAPSLVFTPRNIALDIDAAIVQAILSLRTQREISRETLLENFGFDQSTEAQRMEMEELFFDEIFKTRVPFSSPGLGGDPHGGPPRPPGADGNPKAGRPVGGGDPPQNPAKVKPKSPTGGNTSTGGS